MWPLSLFRVSRHVHALHGSRLEGLVEAINERAWAERDGSPALSAALIERIRTAHQDGASMGAGHLVDELRAIALTHRASDPHLAAHVLGMIGRDGHKHLT
jgi:hypothetical protein